MNSPNPNRRKSDFEPGNRSLIVSILSGKGGVGKSVISFNLAERLASFGNRTLLVDADLSGGNAHILANANCEHGIEEVASGQMTLSDATTQIIPGFDLLGSVLCDPDSVAASVEGVARLMQTICSESEKYDFVIIDHSSGVSKMATAIAFASDRSIITLVPELTSIADAFGLYKYMMKTGSDLDCSILLNRVRDHAEAENVYGKFSALAEKFIGQVPSLCACLSEDDTYMKALAAQRSIASIALESIAGQELTSLATTLISTRRVDQATNLISGINESPAMADIRE